MAPMALLVERLWRLGWQALMWLLVLGLLSRLVYSLVVQEWQSVVPLAVVLALWGNTKVGWISCIARMPGRYLAWQRR